MYRCQKLKRMINPSATSISASFALNHLNLSKVTSCTTNPVTERTKNLRNIVLDAATDMPQSTTDGTVSAELSSSSKSRRTARFSLLAYLTIFSFLSSYYFYFSGIQSPLVFTNVLVAPLSPVYPLNAGNWRYDALTDAGIDPYNGFTLNNTQGTKIGGSTFDSFGRRHTAADLLSYAKSSNIRVAIYGSVERVLLATTTPPSPFRSRGPSYMEFVCNATDFRAEEYYDYIIVRGGTAGCPLAATLSLNHRVLVLERGGVPYGNPNLMAQDRFLATLSDMDAFDSPAQSFTSEDGVPNTRGRVLGGSSTGFYSKVDQDFYSRVDRVDQDFYGRSGLNWDQKSVNKSYDWVERAIVIVFRPQLRNWQSAVRDALIGAGIDPYNGFTLNHTQGTKIGGSTFDSFCRRHTAADLLSYAKASNIRVTICASVERVLLPTITPPSPSPSSPCRASAIGVVYRDRRGQYHHAMVRERGEVILCAGALGSPQLLLLSGIGAKPYLSSWGIPVAHHLPYVAQFLYDNPRNGISIVPPMPLEHSLIQVVGITEAASNIIQFTSSSHTAFLRSPATPLYLTVATLMEKIIGPLSVGSLRLASTDVRVNPIVRFNYFANPIDFQRCVNGILKIADVFNSRSMEDFKFRQWYGGSDFRFVGPELPPERSSDAIMAEFCRRTVRTIWHYHGGCLVNRVVERNFRVLRVDSLRVVDGSTFSILPGTNPQATLLMLGRYVGMKMLRERMRDAAAAA